MNKERFNKLDNAGKCKAWERMTAWEKDICRDISGLTPQLIGMEGWRVEVTSEMTGEVRRFIVGRSTGWRPCHIELKLRTSMDGVSANYRYLLVTKLKKVR